jgi:ribosomal protein L25 (general stress protein Ctc)
LLRQTRLNSGIIAICYQKWQRCVSSTLTRSWLNKN